MRRMLLPLLAACASAPADVGPGTGSVTGAIDGRSFDTVAASWLIGAPDDPARTTVIYVFDQPVACGEITQAAWDETVTDSTQALEMKLIGTAPGAYPIAADGRPSGGESDVNYTVTSTSGTPSEVSATAGSVTVDALTDGTSAGGQFDLTFPGGTVTGAFSAAFCADGREP